MSILALSKIRPLLPGDYNFVLSSFAHSFKSSKYAGTCPAHEWHSQAKLIVDSLLARGAEVPVLCNTEDPDQILGWAMFERADSGVPVVHYVYIKDDFRNDGLARYLVGEIAGDQRFAYTHRTRDAHPRRGTHLPEIAKRKNLNPVRPL